MSLTATHRLADILDDEAGGGWLLAALLDLAGDVLPLVFVALAMLFLYRVLPMHTEPLRDIWPGAVVAAIGLAIVKLGLELYFEQFADFGAIYGSLGAAMALLLFVYAAANVVVFGAEFASEWARSERRGLARIGLTERPAPGHEGPGAVPRRPSAEACYGLPPPFGRLGRSSCCSPWACASWMLPPTLPATV